MSLIPMDKLYLENLEEFIFDDRSFVSYKFLSCKLGVHVNLAKQMLFQFLEMSKRKGKEIHAMYYISGMAPQRWIFSKNFPKEIPSKTNKENTNPLSPDLFVSPSADQEDVYGDANGNLVMLCQDHELEELKEKFTKIFSIHVYGLSTYPMNLEKLNEELSTRVVDGEGRGPNHYGSITCKTASEIREKGNNKQFESAIKNINHVKVPKTEKEEKVIFVKKEKTVEAPAKEKIVEKAVGGVGKDRLKNMFAAAASKPKPKAKEVEVPVESKRKSKEEEKPVKKESTFSKTWNSKRKETLKSKRETEKENLNRKRKRIRDVFSSEEEESDSDRKNTSEEEEDTLPESPIPRKRIQIESDSDDESFKPKSQDEPTTPEQKKSRNSSGEEKTSTGKKRVCKTIKKRHVDEDGFLVTVLQKVMGSDSDSSDESEKVTNVKKESSQSSQEEPCTISKNKPKEEISKKKVAPKKSSPTPATQKAKQSSLMSFFQKK